MFQKFFLIFCFFFMVTTGFSQNANLIAKKSELTSSIYVKNDNYSFLTTSFDEDLKLKGFKFLIFDKENLVNNYFTVDFRNIDRKGSKFYYQSYRDVDLYKHFPIVPDIVTINRFNRNMSANSN